MSLAQGNNTPTRPRIEPGSPDPQSDALNTRPVGPPIFVILIFFLTLWLLYLTYITVQKDTLCKLSFVYTSYIRYGVRAVPKFGKHASLFSYHKG